MIQYLLAGRHVALYSAHVITRVCHIKKVLRTPCWIGILDLK